MALGEKRAKAKQFFGQLGNLFAQHTQYINDEISSSCDGSHSSGTRTQNTSFPVSKITTAMQSGKTVNSKKQANITIETKEEKKKSKKEPKEEKDNDGIAGEGSKLLETQGCSCSLCAAMGKGEDKFKADDPIDVLKFFKPGEQRITHYK